MSAPARLARRVAPVAAACALALVARAGAASACAVCSVLNNENNRRAFFDTTILLSLLPLGLIAWGLAWVARKGRDAVREEFRESDEDLPAPERTPGR